MGKCLDKMRILMQCAKIRSIKYQLDKFKNDVNADEIEKIESNIDKWIDKIEEELRKPLCEEKKNEAL